MDTKRKIKALFQEAKKDICDFSPTDDTFLQELVDSNALNGDDKENLEGIGNRKKRRQELIELLQEKSNEAYFTFMDILETHQRDLHGRLKKLEQKHGITQKSGQTTSGKQASQREMDIPDAKMSQAVPVSLEDRIEPDSEGSYESLHVMQAKPTTKEMNPDKCYPTLLTAKVKGRAYILNVKQFSSSHKLRLGSDVDFDNMKHLFTELGYEITAHFDLSAQEIRTTIDTFVSQFNREHASSVVVLMSHGGNDSIFGKDGMTVDVKTIVEKFKPKNCPALSNKPKLFFIQACRGKRKESAQLEADSEIEVDSEMEVDSVPDIPDVPDNADIYLAFATTEGFLSLRNTVAGSWFVQAILEAFISSAHEESLHQLMNQVTNRVSQKKGFDFYDQETRMMKKIRQTPQIKHSLRKDVYFYPKYYVSQLNP